MVARAEGKGKLEKTKGNTVDIMISLLSDRRLLDSVAIRPKLSEC